MDTRVTKKRLSEMLQYDWIKIIAVIAAAIVVWELIFTMTAVRLKAGQIFKVYYYTGVGGDTGRLVEFIVDEVPFSYDVLKTDLEVLTDEAYRDTILSLRLTVEEGDVIFVGNQPQASSDEALAADRRYDSSHFYHIVDAYDIYDYERLLGDAEDYLGGLKENGEFSAEKIEEAFRKRMKRDNRFRKKADFERGLALETARLEKLEEETAAFAYLCEKYGDEGLFYDYRPYQYSYFVSDGAKEDSIYKELYEKSEEKAYAINAGFLEAYKREDRKISDLMCVWDGEEYRAEGTAIVVFDFKKVQPELQFETIVFVNALVREFTTLLDEYDGAAK